MATDDEPTDGRTETPEPRRKPTRAHQPPDPDDADATDTLEPPDPDDADTDDESLLPARVRPTATPRCPEIPDPRPYIEIRPTTDALDPRDVGESLRRVAALLESETDDGFWKRFRGRARRPAIEWVLVGDGREDARVRWLVGLTLGDGTDETPAQTAAIQADQPAARLLDTPAHEDDAEADAYDRTVRLDGLFSQLEESLRRLLPHQYELTRVQWHPRYVEEHLPVPLVDEGAGGIHPDRHGAEPVHPAITPEDPYVAGVQFRGTSTLAPDWQLPLQAFAPRPSRRVRYSFDSSPSDTGSDRGFTNRSGSHSHSHSHSHSRSHRDALDARRTGSDSFTPPASDTRTTAGVPHTDAYSPLVDIVEKLKTASLPTIYQVVCRPMEWPDAGTEYELALKTRDVTVGDKIGSTLFPEALQSDTLPRSYKERLAGLDEREDAGFVVAARLAVLTRDAPGLANSLATGFRDVLRPLAEPVAYHRIEGTCLTDDDLHARRTPPGRRLFDRLVDRTVPNPSYESREWHRLGRRSPSPGIVVTAAELPGFCVVDGASLTPHGERALAARPAERTGLALPPPGHLAPYRGDGMALCLPLTHDRRPTGRPLVLPEAFQDRHLVIAGGTGAGKSVLMSGLLRSNIDTCGGLHILLDYKGTDSAQEFLQTHYAARGTLADVYYFDLTETLPAFTLFDIRPLLAAGVNREEARSRVAANYVEILRALMTPAKFDKAVYAEEIITTHVRALFDPVHGRDVFSHRDLADALRGTREGAPPPVSDDDLDAMLTGLLAERQDIFEAKINAAISRVNVINSDERLRPLFTHMPDQSADPEGGAPSFGFDSLLDADATVVFDFGGMDRAMKNGLTLAILSALWSALTCRAEAGRDASGATGEPPERRLVKLCLEEAGDVADTALVDTLLREGRGFGLSVTLGVQFPGQLRSADPDRNTYRELINEVGTFVIGNVRLDADLAEALATASMPPEQVATRLRALARGEWLVRPAAAFGADPPRPFLARSLAPPRGHPAGDAPLEDTERLSFDVAFVRAQAESTRYGHAHVEPATGGTLPAHLDRADLTPDAHPGLDPDSDLAGGPATAATDADPGASSAARDADAANDVGPRRGERAGDVGADLPSAAQVDSLLPHTKRLPAAVDYDADGHFLHCVACGTRYDSTFRGLCEGVECCHALATVDRDDIPPSLSYLKRSPDEVRRSRFSLAQLLMMQVVFNAQQQVYEPLEYDLTRDSMNRLREYVGISRDELDALLDAGVLREDTSYPHRLYSLAPQAREIIGEAYREGVDFGDGQGDLEESSEHVMLTETAARWARVAYVDDPSHPGTEVKKYHDIDSGRRLDCAVLDGDGEVCVAIEAERINNDSRAAVPADFDKLAGCEPLEAVWVVSGRSDAHAVLAALNDPLDGEPRVTKRYSESSPPQRWRIDEPGFSRLYTFRLLRRALDEADSQDERAESD